MCGPETQNSQKYAKFDGMSTAELQELLRQDALQPEDAESDIDAILYITEVIARRESAEEGSEIPDAQAAWAQFKQQYYTDDPNGGSLYALEDDASDGPGSLQEETPLLLRRHEQKREHPHRPFRTILVVAAVLAALFLGSLTAYAMGYDPWGVVAQWTRSIFSFTEAAAAEDNVSQNANPKADFERLYQIQGQLVPTWLPDGYQYERTEATEALACKTFHMRYVLAEAGDIISISVRQTQQPDLRAYEKDGNQVTEHAVNDVQHYIMTNNDFTKIRWMNGRYECQISGPFSVREAEKIIDSIYT